MKCLSNHFWAEYIRDRCLSQESVISFYYLKYSLFNCFMLIDEDIIIYFSVGGMRKAGVSLHNRLTDLQLLSAAVADCILYRPLQESTCVLCETHLSTQLLCVKVVLGTDYHR